MKSTIKILSSNIIMGVIAFLLTLTISWEVFGQKTPGFHGFATATVTTTTNGKSQKVKVVSKTFGYYTERTNTPQFDKAIKESLDKNFDEIIEFIPELADELPGSFVCPIRK